MKTNVQPDEFDLLDLCVEVSRSTNIPVLGFDTTYDLSTLVKEDNGVNFGGIGGNIGGGKTKKQKTDDDDDDDEFSFPFKPENDSEDEEDDESEEGTDNADNSDEEEKTEQEVEISGADETSDDNFGEVDKGDNPESGSDYSSITNFGVSLLILAQKAHLWHLNANTRFAHELMGEVYTYMEKAADSLLETIMSDTGSAINPTNDDFDLSGVDYDQDNVVSFLEGIVQQAEALIDSNEDNSAIVNILSDLVEQFKTYIYKLKRLEG